MQLPTFYLQRQIPKETAEQNKNFDSFIILKIQNHMSAYL